MVVDNKIIGKRIRQRREHLNITQERLGEMIGVTYQQIQKYEKGVNKVSAERLSTIAKSMNVHISYFYDNAGEFVVSEENGNANYGNANKNVRSVEEEEFLKRIRLLPDKNARTHLLRFLDSICNK